MTTLRRQLQDFLADWRNDVDASWSAFFDGHEPDYLAVAEALEHDPQFPIIPGRRHQPHPQAPQGAHVFRAFDGIAPADVRVVVIGQDPYPLVTRATGRAFEDGALTAWNGKVAVSLQRIMQSAVALRLGRPDLARTPADWKRIVELAAAGGVVLEAVRDYFDRLQQQHGVLFVNAGWTLTRFVPGGGPEQRAHIALWRPVMNRLLRGLAERPGQPVVYVLLGGPARKLFDAAGVRQRAVESQTWGRSVDAVMHPHPNAPGERGYLASGNPLQKTNERLAALGAAPVAW